MEYKELFNRAKAAYGTGAYDDATLEFIFPELAESEDEKIRKHIVEILKSLPGCHWHGQKEKDDSLAWLEKQKPVEYLSKEKVFDIMKDLTNLSYSHLIPANSNEYKQINEITEAVRSLLDYPIEQKPEWSKEDDKIIESINMVFDMCAAKNIATEETTLYKLRAWLKSLRPTHWKPSKEQMNVLKAVEEYAVQISVYWGEYLHSLFEDLQEL